MSSDFEALDKLHAEAIPSGKWCALDAEPFSEAIYEACPAMRDEIKRHRKQLAAAVAEFDSELPPSSMDIETLFGAMQEQLHEARRIGEEWALRTGVARSARIRAKDEAAKAQAQVAVLTSPESAEKLLGWLSAQKYGDEQILHAIVCCDFVSASRFASAISQQLQLLANTAATAQAYEQRVRNDERRKVAGEREEAESALIAELKQHIDIEDGDDVVHHAIRLLENARGAERCESCDAEATRHDVDNVPLCQACWEDLCKQEDSEAEC